MPLREVETKKPTNPLFQLKELQSLHPEAMENLTASIKYLLSLNTPSISILVNSFTNSRHTDRKIQLLEDWIDSHQRPNPLDLLERMLKYCISEAWANQECLPYAPLSLRRDIPLQGELQNVHRALDIARRCDPDYSELHSTYDQVAQSVQNGAWSRWLGSLSGVLAEEDLEDIRSSLRGICAGQMYSEIPSLYIRITYLLASSGVLLSVPVARYGNSTYAVLDYYFDNIIIRKLETIYGSPVREVFQAKGKDCSETDRKLISILASQQTDWDAIYKNLKASTVTGMAQTF
ncbi:hypothetical protein H072_904 [Dactylellina haptotyla CBS 200.50]|uniref:Uncharacterized protein n=1 Tax=Dactylellina haptotyla (strain CBS 200.50) TaxID=1284197 RepID=S8AVY6_DACHA|nr:hypothetical protein H072_904 [Dactylellina haptotyla CBS 200.50]